MVGKVICDYMERGSRGAKKLVVPGFGTFMRKEGGETGSGEVIFVDLLRKDDGLLRELVEDHGGYSEVEAMALVDRFIFETKNAIECHGSASIEGFGTMTLDAKGSYRFEYTPKAKPRHEQAVQEKLFEESEVVKTTPPLRGTPPQEGNREGNSDNESISRMGSAQSAGIGSPPVEGWQPKADGVVKRRKKSTPSRADIFMIIAIAAAILAILAMVFGLSTTGNSPLPFLNN